MRTEFIAIGHELLQGEVLDTNSAFLGRELSRVGISVRHHTTVGDWLPDIVDAFARAVERSDLIITSGGIGPTEDDLTREGLARVMERQLVRIPRLERDLRRRFEKIGIPFTDNNLRQADIPESAEAILNPVGTAPGIRATLSDSTIVCLPGVPWEFEYLVKKSVIPLIRKLQPTKAVLQTSSLYCLGIGEAQVDARVGDLIRTGGNPMVGIYSRPFGIELRITARAATMSAARVILERWQKRLADRLTEVTLLAGEGDPASALLQHLLSRGESLSVVESGTAGELGRRLVDSIEGRPELVPSLGAVHWSGARTKKKRRSARDLARDARKWGGTSHGLGLVLELAKEGFRIEVALTGGGELVESEKVYRAGNAKPGVRAARFAVDLLWQNIVQKPADP